MAVSDNEDNGQESDMDKDENDKLEPETDGPESEKETMPVVS